MPNATSSQRQRQPQRTKLGKPAPVSISPQDAMETFMAVYSDAHRQLVAIDMYMSSYEDKVEYRTDYAYGAWHGSDWRIQVATLADTLRAKLKRVYLPTISAAAAHPNLSLATSAALKERKRYTVKLLSAISEHDATLVRILADSANTRATKAALRAARLACQHVICEAEEAMYALDPTQAIAWRDLCIRRSATMVPCASRYQ